MTLVRLALLGLVLTTATGAQAQTTGAALTAPRDTTGVGQTKPPSRDASPTSKNNINRRSQNERNVDSVVKGICIGCGPK